MVVIKKILIILLTLTILILSLVYDSLYVAPSRFKVRYETLTSPKIPNQLQDINILYFSDLHYGSLLDNNDLIKLTDLINNCSPDIILFGGDLLANENYSQEQVESLTSLLASLEAPLGKFAVLGEYDHMQYDLATSILYNSNFEVLINKAIKLRNTGSQAINLIGIDCTIDDHDDVSLAYNEVGVNSFNITFAHTPDTCEKLPTDKTDYFISGHTHGGQANLLVKTTYEITESSYSISGKSEVNDSYIMDISTGVGNIGTKIRFLSYPEVVMYRLNKAQESSGE